MTTTDSNAVSDLNVIKELHSLNEEQVAKMVSVMGADYELKGIAFRKLRSAEVTFRELERKIMTSRENNLGNFVNELCCGLCSEKFRLFKKPKECVNCKCLICKNCCDANLICSYCKEKETFMYKKREFGMLCPFSTSQFGNFKFYCGFEAWQMRAKLEFHLTYLLGDSFEEGPILVKIEDQALDHCFKRLQKEISNYPFCSHFSFINSAFRDFGRQLQRCWDLVERNMVAKNRFVLTNVPITKRSDQLHNMPKYLLAIANAVCYKYEVLLRAKIEKNDLLQKKMTQSQLRPPAPIYVTQTSFDSNLLPPNMRCPKFLKRQDSFDGSSQLRRPIVYRRPLNRMSTLEILPSEMEKSEQYKVRHKRNSFQLYNHHLDSFKEEEKGSVCGYNTCTMKSTKSSIELPTFGDKEIGVAMERARIKGRSGQTITITGRIYTRTKFDIHKSQLQWYFLNKGKIEAVGRYYQFVDSEYNENKCYYRCGLKVFDADFSDSGQVGCLFLSPNDMAFGSCVVEVVDEVIASTEECVFGKAVCVTKCEDGKIIVKASATGYPNPWMMFSVNQVIVKEDECNKIEVKNDIWTLEISPNLSTTLKRQKNKESNDFKYIVPPSQFEITAIARNRFGSACSKTVFTYTSEDCQTYGKDDHSDDGNKDGTNSSMYECMNDTETVSSICEVPV
uniref:SET domain-containing protein n=1 Tax=Rhabditophanes sp. KR3021 TaxID=114890 RepID=A0AC35UAP2_9BILA